MHGVLGIIYLSLHWSLSWGVEMMGTSFISRYLHTCREELAMGIFLKLNKSY